MRIKIVFILFGLFLVSGISAQDKSSMKKMKKSRQQSYLKQAREFKDENPNKAIRLLERVIFSKSKRVNYSDKGQAYQLLGEIYEDIDQPELALDRYDEAIRFFEQGKLDIPTSIYHRKGQLHLSLGDYDKATTNFNLCVETKKEKTLTIQCFEGLAEVDLAKGENQKSLDQLDYVQSNYELDSVTISRVEATRAQNYVQQSEYEKAESSYYNSAKNLPTKNVNKKDLEKVEKAKEELIELNNAAPEKQLEIQETSNILLEQKPSASDIVLAENMELSDGFLEKNEVEKAADFVKRSKEIINPKTRSDKAAEVFKQSYEINRKIGNLDEAHLDLIKYTEAKEQAISELENKLKAEIEIVKSQQNIDLTKKDQDIYAKDQALLSSQLQTQKIISGFLGLLLSGVLVFFYFLNKNIKAKRKANQLLLLKSLRTQMNPHFIFNALNSVNNFIAKNDEKAANKFLSDFSKLMRKVLDYSQQNFINLEEEIELNELYLKLEHFRFRDKFDYDFVNEIEHFDMKIPPMLIQPFIENAVWHGLRYKEGHGKLSVHLSDTPKALTIKIQDNGIGRENSIRLKTKNQKSYKSTGLSNISKRIGLINDIYNKNYQIDISNATDDEKEPGTLVTIHIPIQPNNS